MLGIDETSIRNFKSLQEKTDKNEIPTNIEKRIKPKDLVKEPLKTWTKQWVTLIVTKVLLYC